MVMLSNALREATSKACFLKTNILLQLPKCSAMVTEVIITKKNNERWHRVVKIIISGKNKHSIIDFNFF